MGKTIVKLKVVPWGSGKAVAILLLATRRFGTASSQLPNVRHNVFQQMPGTKKNWSDQPPWILFAMSIVIKIRLFFLFSLSIEKWLFCLFLFVCREPGLNTPRITLYGWEACVLQPLCATWAPQFRLRQASVCRSHMNAGYLPVSGPLDFRLVIQVLLSPRMILNA